MGVIQSGNAFTQSVKTIGWYEIKRQYAMGNWKLLVRS